MKHDVIPFDFEEQAVRVILRDGEPWFVAADVCRVLDIANSSDAMSRLDEDEKDGVGITDPIGREQVTRIISESGLYALILTSRKAEAKRFRKWVTAEVLPSIRKTGGYGQVPLSAPQPMRMTDDLTVRDWLSLAREARILHGPRAGRRVWALSPLPQPYATDGGETIGPVAAFLTECCVITGDNDDFLMPIDLVDACRLWQEMRRETPWGHRTISNRLHEMAGTWRHPDSGFTFTVHKAGDRSYRGIKLTEDFRARFAARRSA